MEKIRFSRSSIILAGALAAVSAAAAGAAPVNPAKAPLARVLAARPGAVVDSLPPGITKIADGALIYRPR
ncbi:MAG: hypothetical protein ABIN68_06245, partial [Sphingomicrobium sp.]